ncbi:2-oxoglutarate dehydrogenase, E2 subunit, dihydrolipoamide succinyltransferase [Thioalkalivibrio sp. K90mix]|uniref:2-oxoglutarate dehydrogenase complex dihydrolipoyllysine-residue succinyltransferase n=1 Tax=unclassified Thioalkalivibrio TaxID=2621013 RepID=UPI000195A6EA|nr:MULTISPECIES: 2-oxoglutarate dehydrogenase complex dihydrolipoyllysine-residue succinyltransferase [unclassified Thioalkalivibrio]ADC70615.1 2-oxoglutarate dehydrogenase, E2 subunit, dihydrolipoamide succinyltransferase [Thioalkalivibrio sp. K90mix]
MASDPTPIQVPELPESVADATVVALHKKAGDAVKRDELIAELETDKVVLEVSAPSAGTLTALEVSEGDVVKTDAVIGYLSAADEAAADDVDAEEEASTPAQDPRESTDTKAESSWSEKDDRAQAAAKATPDRASGSAPPTPSPAVRRLLQEAGLKPEDVEGTGEDGRILREDVERAQAARSSAGQASSPAPKAERSPAREPAPTAGGIERVPMTRLRARIAERLLEAKQSTAMLTTFNEIDMSAAMDLRARYKETFEKRHSIKLGFMGLFVAAASRALERFPIINAALDGEEIVYHHYSDIGIAVSSPRGLVVPVLRDTGNASISEIERRIRDFAERARDGKLDIDELRGGTFTITNGGVFGSLFSTPIVNPPQSAILGMHAIKERPVAVDGQVVIRPMMYVALSYDHRLVDGADAVRFLVAIKDAIEDPARLLLDV